MNNFESQMISSFQQLKVSSLSPDLVEQAFALRRTDKVLIPGGLLLIRLMYIKGRRNDLLVERIIVKSRTLMQR